MATLAAAEPAICPSAIAAAESIVPACMFAPDRDGEDDPCGAEGSEACDGTNGESADHLDLSSKVGPYSQWWSSYCTRLDTSRLQMYVFRRLSGFCMHRYCISAFAAVVWMVAVTRM